MIDVPPAGDPPRLLPTEVTYAERRQRQAAAKQSRRAEAVRVRAAVLPGRMAARASRLSGGGRR